MYWINSSGREEFEQSTKHNVKRCKRLDRLDFFASLRLCEEKNPLILVRSASADRERLFMPFSTGYTRGYAQLDPLRWISPPRWTGNAKSISTLFPPYFACPPRRVFHIFYLVQSLIYQTIYHPIRLAHHIQVLAGILSKL